MRALLVATMLVGALGLASFQPPRPAAPVQEDGEAVAACDPPTDDCRGEAGQVATAAAFAEAVDFGIAATFPTGVWVCPALSGDAVRGYYTRVGLDRFDCLGRHVDSNASSHGIRARWNASFEPSLDAARSEDRPCRMDDLFSRGPDGERFAVQGVDSRVCVDREPDGRILIDVEAATGRWDGFGEQAEGAPKSIYTAWLLTSDADWGRDSVLFEAFLDWLIVAPEDNANCFWERGRLRATNGSPGVRIFLPTGRVLGVTSPSGDEGPDLLPPAAMALLMSRKDVFTTDVTGDWLLCALQPDRSGWMRFVRVTDGRDLHVSTR